MPVVMVTDSESKGRAMAAMQQGANAYLLKPFNPAKFMRITGQWFGTSVNIIA
jgi:AmiR/NasT family two-component response regulator